MATSSTSSLTSTSHTLTVAPPMASGSFPSLSDISAAIAFRNAFSSASRKQFLKPLAALPTASTQFAQVSLDSFAGQVSDEQQERLRLQHAESAARKKRKRNGKGAEAAELPAPRTAPVGPQLKLRKVHVDGFETPQIWQQANRILSASLVQLHHNIELFEEEDDESAAADSDAESAVHGDFADSDSASVDLEDDGSLLSFDEASDEDADSEDLEVGEESEEEEEDEDEEGRQEDEEEEESVAGPTSEYVEDADGLNDGFFNIDDFNKTSQYFEDQDARANPNTDKASDDEELDWHADPFAVPSGKQKTARKAKAKTGTSNKRDERDPLFEEEEDDDSEEEEEDEGPIFGDMDLDAPSGESDGENDEEMGGLESGLTMDLGGEDLYYKDFFAPPAQKADKGRKRETSPYSSRPAAFQPDEQDVRRAMADVKRDLFEQISEGEDSEDGGLSDVSDGNPRARRSAHERRQAKILAEIRRLEAEAVREKDWTLSGEASAGARPLNSLLEEDLAFEHIGKPVPVITQAVTEDLEALTKRRILAQEFDEVRRRYATAGADGEGARRGLVEIDDQQAKKGLAALYEEEHQQATQADAYVSASDEKRAAEEREVERLWAAVSTQLDALSSWHYKPRPAAAALTVVADVATVAMEDAQPATAQGVAGGASMLAPQEVYKPGAAADGAATADKGIVTVRKSGLPVARDEMSREEKARRRRRNKERIAKSGSGLLQANGAPRGAADGAASGKAAALRQDTMATLKKAGVKVIGRKGEIEDLDGNKPRAARTVSSGHFKL